TGHPTHTLTHTAIKILLSVGFLFLSLQQISQQSFLFSRLEPCGARNALSNMELKAYKRLLKKFDAIDESYRRFIMSLISKQEQFARKNDARNPRKRLLSTPMNEKRALQPRKMKLKQKIDANTNKARENVPVPQQKRKGKEILIENDTNYVLFLRFLKNQKDSRAAAENKKECSFDLVSQNREVHNINENIHVDSDSDSDSDVVILDTDCLNGKTPFVPSRRFQRDVEDFASRGNALASEFRKEVMEVLNKPFDKDEYVRLKAELDAQGYAFYYPDTTKRSAWLFYVDFSIGFRLNLTRDGAFKPWKDLVCLSIEPQYPKNNPGRESGS
ncbi:RAB geranylgeranyl transferase alpha subunit 1, partial [Striga asiatica]